MSIGMSPFKALYGYEATTFGDLIIQESRVLGARISSNKALIL